MISNAMARELRRRLDPIYPTAVEIPMEFRCPLSKQLMIDPVLVCTGQTYDRLSIEKWLREGNQTCPRTQQVLSETTLTTNHLIRLLITEWCKNHSLELPNPFQHSNEDGRNDADRHLFLSLLGKMSSTLSYDQMGAARELRLLTERKPSFRTLFGEYSNFAIPDLLKPLSQSENSQCDVDPDLQEDLITTILNLSLHDNNKNLIAEKGTLVFPLLIEALDTGTTTTSSNAAAALFTLSDLNSNKEIIGSLGALKPLIYLLDRGHPFVMKDVASAIFNLCILEENKARAATHGAVEVILRKIGHREFVDELLAILAMLANNQMAEEEMGKLAAARYLVSVITERSSSEDNDDCMPFMGRLEPR